MDLDFKPLCKWQSKKRDCSCTYAPLFLEKIISIDTTQNARNRHAIGNMVKTIKVPFPLSSYWKDPNNESYNDVTGDQNDTLDSVESR